MPTGLLRAASGVATVAPGGPRPEASGQSPCWQEAPWQECGGAADSCFLLPLLGCHCPCEKNRYRRAPSPALCDLGPVPFFLWALGFYSRLLWGCSWCPPSPTAPTPSHEPWAGEGLVLAGVKWQCLPAACLLDLNPGAWRGQGSPADLDWVAEQDPEENGWTDGHMWTQGRPEEGEPAFLPSAHPHSGGRGSQVKEVRQGCPLNTEPALGAGPLGRWTPAMALGCMAALLSPVSCPGEAWKVPLRTLVLQVGHRVQGGERAAPPPQGAQAVPNLGAGPEPAAALLPDGHAGTGRG